MLIAETLKGLQAKDLMKIIEKCKSPNSEKDEELLAIYNSDRATRYDNVEKLEFLDFAQLHAFKIFADGEMIDRAFSQY